MAFYLTLNPEDFVLDGASSEADQEDLATVAIGYDDDGATYKIFVALVPVAAHPPSFKEIIFAIRRTALNGYVETYKSGNQTTAFLSTDDRLLVLQGICVLICHLADLSGADVLVMNTVETNLPHKALVKYGLICKSLADVGYQGGRVDDYHGSRQWQLRKIDKTDTVSM